MPRPKKDAKPLNIKLDASIYKKLEQYCYETGMNKTVTVEKILDQYLSSYFEREKLEPCLLRAKEKNILVSADCNIDII